MSRDKDAGQFGTAPPDSFSQNERQFMRSFRCRGNVPVASVVSDMNYLRGIDQKVESRSRFSSLVVMFGLLTIVIDGFFVVTAIQPNTPYAQRHFLFIIAGGIAVIGVLAMLGGIICKHYFKHFDIDNRRYEFVSGLLELLRRDMAEDAAAEIDVNFLPHNHRSKYLRTGKVGNWNVVFYTDPWFVMRGRFLDGTKFSVTLLEKQQDRMRWKRGRTSGKMKKKRKTKIASEIIVRLNFKNKRYPQAQELSAKVQQFVRLPQWAELKSVAAEGESMTIRSTTKKRWGAGKRPEKRLVRDGVEWVSMAFLSLYKLLNDAK